MDSHELAREIEQVLAGARVSNLYYTTIPQLFHCNLARGRGFFARAVLNLVCSSSSTDAGDEQLAMLAAIVAVVNSKLPIIGKLVLFRSVQCFNAFKNSGCSNLRDGQSRVCSFIVHLTNQGVCGEILPLEMLLALLERVEKTQAGDLLFRFVVDLVYRLGNHFSTRAALETAMDSLFAGLRERAASVPHRTTLVQELERVRAARFALFPSIPQPELDLLLPHVRILHEVFLDDAVPSEVSELDFYTLEPPATTRLRVAQQDQAWFAYQRQCLERIIPDQITAEEEEPAAPARSAKPASQQQQQQAVAVEDRTSRDVLEVRKRIYLTLNHGLSFEQVAHELILQRAPNKPLHGHDLEIVQMLIEFCAQLKSFTDFIGLLCCRLCIALGPQKPLVPLFEQEFARQYANMHMLETTKMRNLALLLAQMLYRDCLNWKQVFSCVQLSETDTTSSSRIFLKFLFQRLAQLMGMDALRQRLTPLADFPGLFPQGKRAKQVRFAVNFFTSIGLGSFTVEMRDWLASGREREESSSSSDSSSSESSSESSSSDSEEKKKKKRRKHKRSKKSSKKHHDKRRRKE